MHLTEAERERVLLFSVAEMARRRRSRGVKLNYPEAVALIADEVLERAREGWSYEKVIAFGSTILSEADVLPGVAEMLTLLEVEGLFTHGKKLIALRHPIKRGDSA